MATIDSGPQPLDWKVYAGDSNREAYEFLADGMPWDLTGAVIAAQARAEAPDEEVAATAIVTVVDAALGRYTVEWDGEGELRALLAGQEEWAGVWDLEVLEAGETLPRSLLYGTFTVLMDVTRTAVV